MWGTPCRQCWWEQEMYLNLVLPTVVAKAMMNLLHDPHRLWGAGSMMGTSSRSETRVSIS